MKSSVALYPESISTHVHAGLAARYTARMDSKAIRLANLARLVSDFGGLQAVANLVGTSYDTLWQAQAGIKLPSGKTRGIGDNMARRLEQACKKPIGWMDWDHNSPQGMSPTAIAIGKIYDSLPPEERARQRRIWEAATGYAIPDEEVENRIPATKPKESQKRRNED